MYKGVLRQQEYGIVCEVCPGAGSGSEEGEELLLCEWHVGVIYKMHLQNAKQNLMNYQALKIDRPRVAFSNLHRLVFSFGTRHQSPARLCGR